MNSDTLSNQATKRDQHCSPFAMISLGLKLNQLLRAFALYEKKPANKRSIVVLRNLTQSYHGSDVVSQEQLQRVSLTKPMAMLCFFSI